MNFKKGLVVFTVMFCIFFSISCVAAEDVNDANITTYENQAVGDENDEVIASCQDDLVSSGDDDVIASSNEDLLSSSNKGTFSELQNLIYNASNGATINLEKDYTYDEGFNFGSGILILKNLTINGNGHTLDGLSKSRILFVMFGLKENNKVTLNNIVFKNGFTKLYGGAILNFADLKINKCTFNNNYAGTTAGAICSLGSLNCKNSNFNKNTANGSAGAIFSLNIKGSNLYFKNYNVTKASDLAGMISNLLMDYTLIPLTDYISGCKFSNNVALGRGGGAIYAYTHINIASSTFTSNKADQVGGAVYAAKNLVIKNSKFSKNKVSSYGGAVYFKFHELGGHYDKNGNWKTDVKFYTSSIKNCVFKQNVANDRGGAIYGFKYSKKPKVEAIRTVKCTFSDNIAKSDGNEIYGGVLKSCTLKNTLTLKTVKVKKSAKSLVLTVTLKKGSKVYKNKNIVFTFNGKTYKAKTNSKGIAKATVYSDVLNKLKVGKTIKYQATNGKFTDRKTAKVLK